MFNFREPRLTDRTPIQSLLNAVGAKENDAAFVNLYLLRKKYGTQLAISDAMLLRFYTEGFRANCYGFPLGVGNLKQSILQLYADAVARAIPFRLTLLTQDMCTQLNALFPDCFSFVEAEGYTEYLYLQSHLATLSGSRYHKKRNHIAQFWRQYPDAEIQPLIPENVEYAVQIAYAWLCNRSDAADPSVQAEFACIQEAATHFAALGLTGLLLYANNQPIGMTMTSEISAGISDIHFEKVLPGYPHAWPVVANEMAKCLPQARYLNREEDLGTAGMRSSKTSYHPDLLQPKMIATWDRKEAPSC